MTVPDTPLFFLILGCLLTLQSVTVQALGSEALLSAPLRLREAAARSGAAMALMLVCLCAVWPIDRFLLLPYGLRALALPVCVIVIAAVWCGTVALSSLLPRVREWLLTRQTALLTDAAVLGCLLVLTQGQASFGRSVLWGAVAGAVYVAASCVFSAIRDRLSRTPVPEGMKGLPVTIAAAALVCLVFSGLYGLWLV